jgi:hypothetical protein
MLIWNIEWDKNLFKNELQKYQFNDLLFVLFIVK